MTLVWYRSFRLRAWPQIFFSPTIILVLLPQLMSTHWSANC